MIIHLKPKEFLEASHIPVVDVRSPGEFEQGHIPGAINVPLFDNAERAVVGTLYKKSGPEAALLKGLDISGPKMTDFVKQGWRHAVNHEVRMHCWRGGKRSDSMAWLFSTAGIKVHLLRGGYKTYRRYIRERLEADICYFVLSGRTGTGKTEILRELKKTGQQVLDLEGIAHHKGSAFGAIGELPQPTNEQFENDVFQHWSAMDFDQPIWLEDESRAIGRVSIPEPLFVRMRSCTVIEVDMPAELRVQRLVKDYAAFPEKMLIDSVERISRRLGGQHTQAAVKAIESGDFETAIGIVLRYYDKTYSYGLHKRSSENIHTITTSTTDAAENARMVADYCISQKLI